MHLARFPRLFMADRLPEHRSGSNDPNDNHSGNAFRHTGGAAGLFGYTPQFDFTPQAH